MQYKTLIASSHKISLRALWLVRSCETSKHVATKMQRLCVANGLLLIQSKFGKETEIMPKVIIKTRETIGEASYETLYEFENASDFLAYEEWKEGKAREMAEHTKAESESLDMVFEVKKESVH
jgi:hypothetical protein